MKKTLFTLLLLGLGPALRADAPMVVSPEAPVVESNGMVELLMADGTAKRVRKIKAMQPDSLRVMTDEGVGNLPLHLLHPLTLVKLNSMVETPEQHEARMQKEAAMVESQRQYREMRERRAAQDNAVAAANQREEAARQQAARQAAAEAQARQQQALMEAMRIQEQQRAKRQAELAAAERRRAEAEERWRRYNLDLATLKALQDLTYIAQLEYLRKLGYVIQ